MLDHTHYAAEPRRTPDLIAALDAHRDGTPGDGKTEALVEALLAEFQSRPTGLLSALEEDQQPVIIVDSKAQAHPRPNGHDHMAGPNLRPTRRKGEQRLSLLSRFWRRIVFFAARRV